jgi:hypothetical protein
MPYSRSLLNSKSYWRSDRNKFRFALVRQVYSGEVHSSVLSFTHRRKYGQNAGRGFQVFPWTVNEIEDIKK